MEKKRPTIIFEEPKTPASPKPGKERGRDEVNHSMDDWDVLELTPEQSEQLLKATKEAGLMID